MEESSALSIECMKHDTLAKLKFIHISSYGMNTIQQVIFAKNNAEK